MFANGCRRISARGPIFPGLKTRNPAKMRLAMSLHADRGNNLRPELELILCCARTHLDEAAAGHHRALLEGGLNWSDVAATALRHHVVSFLYDNLTLTAEELVPTVWLDSIRQHVRK